MLNESIVALRMTVVTLVLTGLVYPLVITGVARAIFPDASSGSLVKDENGTVVGSRLIGQAFSNPAYLQPRPSAAGATGYDATASSGSNLGPTSQKLHDRVQQDVERLKKENPDAGDTDSGRPGDRLGQRIGSARVAGRSAVAGAADCQGPGRRAGADPSGDRSEHRAADAGLYGRGARQRVGGQSGLEPEVRGARIEAGHVGRWAPGFRGRPRFRSVPTQSEWYYDCAGLKVLIAYPKTASEKGTVPFCSADCANWDSPRQLSDRCLIEFAGGAVGWNRPSALPR